jgi:glycosyltransferase involved in cell wall biosynthesis
MTTEQLPVVSVLMPVFNSAEWLAEAIKSIQCQTITNFEFVIIDDGSTDASECILRRNARNDPRIRLWRQEHLGIAAALNRGIGLVRSRFIARMDADDVAHAERLQKQLSFLQAHPEVGAVGSWAHVIDEDDRQTGELRPESEPSKIRELLSKRNPFVHSSMMISADLVRRVGGYRSALDGAEDYDLWLRISECAKLANLPEPLMSYRRRKAPAGKATALKQLLSARLARIAAAERRARINLSWRDKKDHGQLPPDFVDKLQHPIGLSALEGTSDLRTTRLLYNLLATDPATPVGASELRILGHAALDHAERRAAQYWLKALLMNQRAWTTQAAAFCWLLYLHPARGISLMWSALLGR